MVPGQGGGGGGLLGKGQGVGRVRMAGEAAPSCQTVSSTAARAASARRRTGRRHQSPAFEPRCLFSADMSYSTARRAAPALSNPESALHRPPTPRPQRRCAWPPRTQHARRRALPGGCRDAGARPGKQQTSARPLTEDALQLLHRALGPDAEAAQVATRRQLQQVEAVHAAHLHARQVAERAAAGAGGRAEGGGDAGG